MSEVTQQQQSTRQLTEAQKKAARQLGMSEKEYAVEVDKGVKNGRINPNNIP